MLGCRTLWQQQFVKVFAGWPLVKLKLLRKQTVLLSSRWRVIQFWFKFHYIQHWNPLYFTKILFSLKKILQNLSCNYLISMGNCHVNEAVHKVHLWPKQWSSTANYGMVIDFICTWDKLLRNFQTREFVHFYVLWSFCLWYMLCSCVIFPFFLL